MALTLQAQQLLDRAGLTAFYERTQETWLALARRVYGFVARNYPAGSAVRRDDVAQSLLPFLEVNEDLTNALDAAKLTQKYWRAHFCDLVIDRCWPIISAEDMRENV